MSFITTGQLAKQANVSVRTVQYYDRKGILLPSDYSEGGRRLYSEKDLQRLQLICFLRDLDFSIVQIKRILAEDNSYKVIELILKQHLCDLQTEVDSKVKKIDRLVNLSKELNLWKDVSEETLTAVSRKMENHKKQKHTYICLISLSLLANILLGVSIWLSFQWHNVWPFVIGVVIALAYTMSLVNYFYHQFAYLCPECHQLFQPVFKAFLLARHTPKTRRLTCPNCHQTSYCMEVLMPNEKDPIV